MTEDISESGAIIVATTIPAAADGSMKPPVDGDKLTKKKRGSFSLAKAAMAIWRQRPAAAEKPKQAQAKKQGTSKGTWKNLVGSMRPLHLQDNQSPPPSEPPSSPPPKVEEMVTPDSPSPSSSSAVSGSCTMSQYASANNLQDFDKLDEGDDDEEEDPDEVFDAICADEMIDAKADEFIAKFYLQMRLQKSNRTRQHHHHRKGM